MQIAKISALQIEYSPWTTDIERSGSAIRASRRAVLIVDFRTYRWRPRSGQRVRYSNRDLLAFGTWLLDGMVSQ